MIGKNKIKGNRAISIHIHNVSRIYVKTGI
jgi:hypothetical protein